MEEDLRKKYRVPAFCPLCTFLMKGDKSNQTFYDYGVCVRCFIFFIETREERWKSGWRPSPEDLERYRELMRGP